MTTVYNADSIPLSAICLARSGIEHEFREDDLNSDSFSVSDVNKQLATLLCLLSSVTSIGQTVPNNDTLARKNTNSLQPDQDKGYAWVIALCSTLVVFSTWGANASYGIFLGYYLSHDSFPHATEYDFALIGSLIFFSGLGLSPVAALLYNIFGFKTLAYSGIVLQTAGYILASFATEIWQLYLTQSIMIGISLVLIYLPTTLVVPTWFNKYLLTCMGICAAGIGLGGCVFSFSVNAMIERTGSHKWALRMVGFVTLATCFISVLFIKPRVNSQLPLKKTLTKEFISTNYKIIFDWNIFKLYPMIILSVWYGLAFMGYIVCLFSLSAFARLVGLSSNQGTVLTALINAGQTIGRPMMGLYADYFGRTNFTIIMNLMAAILIYGWWINATSYGSLIGFSITSGLFFGVSSTMGQSLAFDIVEDRARLPGAWSAINVVGGVFTLVSEVIALELVIPDSKHPYLNAQIYGGACFAVGIILLLINREWLVRRRFKRQIIEECENQQSDKTIIQTQIEKYDKLLAPNIFAYFVRMFYPTII